jgi:hypothetical protein
MINLFLEKPGIFGFEKKLNKYYGRKRFSSESGIAESKLQIIMIVCL